MTARVVALDFLVNGKPPRSWHTTTGATVGKPTFTRGTARVTGDLAN